MTAPSDAASTANPHRVSTARCALNSASLAKGEVFDSPRDALIELFVDLRHYCDARNIDFFTCCDLAMFRYYAQAGQRPR